MTFVWAVIALMMEAVSTSQTSVIFYQTTQRSIPEDMRFLTAASMMFRVVFWDILPCKIIVDRRFRGAYCLAHSSLMM
jgi:hypothetical protein